MLKSGKEHLEGLKDGRAVYIGKDKVDDVTSHPAFANGARTLASLYDLKLDHPASAGILTHEEDGEVFGTYYMKPRSREDLVKRMKAHKLIADRTFGLFGRSPDHVSSFVAGMATQAEVLESDGSNRGFATNLRNYYSHARSKDLYIAYAVIPAPGARDPNFAGARGEKAPDLRVVREDDDGVVVSGMKLLATGAAFSDEIWVGNVQPLAPERKDEAMTFAIPTSTNGITVWSRKPLEPTAVSEFDNPLTYRFDETDGMVLFDNVKVPWERVFCRDNPGLSRDMYYRTPSHCFGNHQANVRFWAKLQFLVGIVAEITRVNQSARIPHVKDQLGRLAALEAMIAGMIHGQIENHEDLGNGYVTVNRRYMYGALTWCTEVYAQVSEQIRELMGGGVFMMPADISVALGSETKETFESYWAGATDSAVDRVKLFKLAWDMLGSEFGSRHWQYERFYAGPPYVVRDHSFREAPWSEFRARVTDFMKTYDVPSEWPPHRNFG